MKKAKYIQLLLLIIVTFTTSFVLAKFSYNKLDKRLQSKLFLKEDKFVIGQYDEQYFTFKKTIFEIVEKIRFFEIQSCNIDKIRSVIPISVLKDGDDYVVEIINSIKKDNVECFENILSMIDLQFYDNVNKKISEINLRQSLRTEALMKLQSENNNLILQKIEERKIIDKSKKNNIKKINFSEFLKLLNNDKVLEISITQDIIMGEMINGDDFFTFFKDVNKSDYLIKTFYDKGVDFYFINEKNDSNNFYREKYYAETILEYDTKIMILQNKLDRKPYILVNILHDEVKLNFKIYLLIIFMVLIFFGIIIFIYYNKIHFKSLLKFLKKIS